LPFSTSDLKSLLEHAQQLGLQIERQLAELVEEHGAAARELERALARRDRAGERALLVAEQLALDQRASDRAAVHHDERRGGARRQQVQGPRDHVLAGAGLALDQHGRVGRRDALHQSEDLAHRRRLADHLAEPLLLARQDLDALLERRELELAGPQADHRAGAQVRLLDLGAVEERAVGRLQIAHQVALGVAHDLEVDARHGLVAEHQVVLGRLADPEHVARDHELGAALRTFDHDELAAPEVDGRGRRFTPDARPRQVLHRENGTAIHRTLRVPIGVSSRVPIAGPVSCLGDPTRVPFG
jgi:hypothetical protein